MKLITSKMFKLSRAVFVLFCAAVFLFSIPPLEAQTPSAQQLKQLQQLPSHQRDQLLRQFGYTPEQYRQFLASSSSSTGTDRTSVDKRPDSYQQFELTEKDPNGQRIDPADDETDKKSYKQKEQPLKPFGHDLFSYRHDALFPDTSIPVPTDYIIGPGDQIRIQLYGNRNEFYQLTVSRDGTIDMPESGPKMVAGNSFDEVRSLIQRQISHQYIGTQSNVTLGELRSIRVFVLGEAQNPGTYTISSFSTITNALMVSGGVTPHGSLRHIEHKRNGELIGTLDLYDLLLRGDTNNDNRLLPGDVVFIPAVTTMVGIKGEVRRPALYELKGESTPAELVRLAGGLTADAFPRRVELSRIAAPASALGQQFDVSLFENDDYRLSTGRRIERLLDLTSANDNSIPLRMGDLLTIERLDEFKDGFVEITGESQRNGHYAWYQGMRVADLFRDLTLDLTPAADPGYAVLIRETPQMESLLVYDFNLRAAVVQRDEQHNLELQPQDRVLILSNLAAKPQRDFWQRDADRRQEPYARDTDRLQEPYARDADRLQEPSIRSTDRVREPYSRNHGRGEVSSEAAGQRQEIKRDADDRLLHIADLEDLQRKSSPIPSRIEQLNVALKQIRAETGRPVIVHTQIDHAESYVTLRGEVTREGRYPWSVGIRVSHLVRHLGFDLNPEADFNYALIVRHNPDRTLIQVVDFSPKRALEEPESMADPILERRDELIFLSRNDAQQREEALWDVLDQLAFQTPVAERSAIFNISGAVRFPGRYPLTAGATLLDAFRAGGGLREHALVNEGEIVRMIQDARGITDVEIIEFHPEEIVKGSQSVALQERDRVLVKAMPEFDRSHSITLAGEVLYPGTYSFRQGETLKDVVERAGGLTERAFPAGAVFTRERLRALERQRLEEAERRLRADLANIQLEGDRLGGTQQEASELQRILDLVGETDAVGRLVIDLQASLAGEPIQQIVLNDGDRLTVPPVSQSVSVFGEVQFPSSHLYQPGLTVDNYLERSGGPTRAADVRRAYVIRADGSVSLPRSSRWFPGRSAALQPGDTVVMPIQLDRVNQLQLLTNVTQIVSQLAFTAAALNNL